MGYAERARRANEQLELHTYRVRRWTAFTWQYPEGSGKAIATIREKLRKHHEESLESAAMKMVRRLERMNDGGAVTIKRVGVKRKPQLLFELVLTAPDEEGALKLAEYRIKKTLSVKVAPDRNQKVRDKRVGRVRLPSQQERTLKPPWGRTEVELIA